MKAIERTVLLAIPLIIVGGAYAIYYEVQSNRAEVLADVREGKYEIREEIATTSAENWQDIYPYTVPILIKDVVVQASIADTMSSRIKGLSGTPFLPENVVKLFAFGVSGNHSIWMKDMNYSIDILWLDESGQIVHIEESVSPDTFPEAFSSPTPAWFVIEAAEGFVSKNNIALGDQVILPTGE